MTLGQMVVYRERTARIIEVDSNKPEYFKIIVYYPDVERYETVSNVHESYLTEFRPMNIKFTDKYDG
jgi:hypothetical protein